MDAAIRWSPHTTSQRNHFLIIDVANYRLRLCKTSGIDNGNLKYSTVCVRDKLPNYTAFDWSKTHPQFVAVGAASGEAHLVQLDPDKPTQDESSWSFPIKHQRKCNSIAFSGKNYLATGLDRVRSDFCMNIYDLNGADAAPQEPYKKLAFSEAITSIKFFNNEPDTFVAGVLRQCVRLYDLRDSSTSGYAQFATRQVHNLAIDPLDDNYFISAGPAGEPVVSVWDRRFATRTGPTTPSEGPPPGPVLEIKPAIDNREAAAIWGLRFSGTKRGCFGILSSTGEMRVFELAQHALKQGLPTPSSQGGSSWTSSKLYTRRTHDLSYPYYEAGIPEPQRIMAYDFIGNSDATNGLSVVGLHAKGVVELLDVPDIPPKINITTQDEILAIGRTCQFYRPKSSALTVAEDLAALEGEIRNTLVSGISNATLDTTQRSAPGQSFETAELPRGDATSGRGSGFLSFAWPDYRVTVQEALQLERIQKRRCLEGYMLNAQINKQIVAEDARLVAMWDTIRRSEDLTKNGGMRAGGLDLSYLGVYHIWNSSLGVHRNRTLPRALANRDTITEAITMIIQRQGYPAYRGIKTKRPSHRQLCLALCGWTFSRDRLQQKCRLLMDDGQYYKAIVIAVMRGFKDLALECLRAAIQQKTLHNIGLGAVIACETVNAEQRELCAWMQDETDDPYLKALLAYFVTGDWKVVTDMPAIALPDRLGVALKYLEDGHLSDFIAMQMARAINAGNVEGLILTGLSDRAVDLFQTYITTYSDLQTPVLAMSFVCPLYLASPRVMAWHETYTLQMQAWRAFPQRVAYMEEHRKRSIIPDTNRQHGANAPQKQSGLACNYCHKAFGFRRIYPGPEGSDTVLSAIPSTNKKFSNSPSAHNGTLCPQCGHIMPSCGVCGLLVGTPDPKRLNALTVARLGDENPPEEASKGRATQYCFSCQHVFHEGHAREWFTRHRMCPVPECRCMCGLLQ